MTIASPTGSPLPDAAAPALVAPRVSVVIAFRDGEPFLGEAIDSVVAQTFRDWELLLVDDGSTDESPRRAGAAAERWPGRVRVLRHPGGENRGLSASRNLGIEHARGEYVAFLDADDVWLPEKLALQVAALDAHPEVAMVYAATEWWYGWTGDPADARRDFVRELHVPAGRVHPPPTLLPTWLQDGAITPCTCSILVRRDEARRVGGFEPSFRHLYEDQVFYAKVCLTAPVLRLAPCVARYRQHPTSMSVNRPVDRDAARLTYLEWLRAHLAATGTGDAAVHDALRAEHRKLVPTAGDRMRAAAKRIVLAVGRRVVPKRLRPYLRDRRALRTRLWRAPGLRRLRATSWRRLVPLYDGRPPGTWIVRHYWADFLDRHRDAVRGRALEIGSTDTIREYGAGRIDSAEALDVTRHSPDVGVVADLARADDVPGERFDCFVLQFTMHVIADVDAALHHAIRLLKPGGDLLVNFSCVDYQFPTGLDMGTGTPLWVHWCFTPLQVHNLLRRAGLGPDDYHLEVYGNLLTRVAYQLCVPVEELTREELEHRDPGHPVLVCVRVTRPVAWSAPRPEYRDAWVPDAVPHRHNARTGFYPL